VNIRRHLKGSPNINTNIVANNDKDLVELAGQAYMHITIHFLNRGLHSYWYPLWGFNWPWFYDRCKYGSQRKFPIFMSEQM